MAKKHNFTLAQGTTYTFQILWNDSSGNPHNLTGFHARMQLRAGPGTTPIYEDASDLNNKIILGGLTGLITVTIPAIDSVAFAFSAAEYDILLTSPTSDTTRVLEGTITLSLGITVNP